MVSGPRRANVDGLQLNAAALTMPAAGFAADSQMRVDRHVFAIGDVTDGPRLAHRANAQARVAGDVLGGRPAALDLRALPRVVFAEPELAGVGAVEGESVRFPFAALGRAVVEGTATGFVKIVFDPASKVVTGAHIAGPRATDLIGEYALAVEMGATLDDLALTSHAHPTFAEAAFEAAELGLGHPVHVRSPKR